MFLLFAVSLRTFTALGFVTPHPNQADGHNINPSTHHHNTATALHAFKNPLSSFMSSRRRIRDGIKRLADRNKKFTPERRQRIRQEIQYLEDEDFLFMDLQPKILIHERDFFRQASRTSAWEQYVVVSILCSSISFGALSNFALNPDHEGIYIYDVVLRSIVQLVASVSCLCGLYSTMVFSLSILYGRTALGLERDVQYDRFLDNTQDIRDAGFLSFSSSLALFAVLVVLVLAEDLPLVMGFPIGFVMSGALVIGFRDWERLVVHAADIFFDDDED